MALDPRKHEDYEVRDFMPSKDNHSESVLVTIRSVRLGRELLGNDGTIEVTPPSVLEAEQLLRKNINQKLGITTSGNLLCNNSDTVL